MEAAPRVGMNRRLLAGIVAFMAFLSACCIARTALQWVLLLYVLGTGSEALFPPTIVNGVGVLTTMFGLAVGVVGASIIYRLLTSSTPTRRGGRQP